MILVEGNFEVLLVNAQHVKRVPGRKTDANDAVWLAELLLHGLLKPSFIPPQPQRELRDLTRYRVTLVQERARVVNRVQKLLEGANITLASVATDGLGVSGRAMLQALAAGATDPAQRAELARGRLRHKLPELQRALTGVVGPHQRFLVAQQLAHIDFLDEQIAQLDSEIDRQLQTMSDPPSSDRPQPPDWSPGGEEPLTWEEAVNLWDSIPGVERTAAEAIVAELGIDMNQFPTERHAAAWSGLAPGNRPSGGKTYASPIRQGNRAVRRVLVQCAWAGSRTKGTYFSALYHRLAGRRGKKRAIIAVAHSRVVSGYHMIRDRVPYRDLGADHFDQRAKESKLDWLTRELRRLGFSVTLEPLVAAT